MEGVRRIADEVRSSRQEVHVWFRVTPQRDLRACAAAVRGMQAAFSSVRAKARRRSAQLAGENFSIRDAPVRGPYDDIACVKHILPQEEGFKLVFMPGFMYAIDAEITNAKGEPLQQVDPTLGRFHALFMKVLLLAEHAHKHQETWHWPLNPEETSFIREYDQAQFEAHILPQYLPWMQEDKPTHSGSRETQFGEVVDLADLGEEELEFDNGEEAGA
jgi:hypothetical protein